MSQRLFSGRRVRLCRDIDGHDAGTEAVIVGRYADDGAVVVRFDDGETARLPEDALESDTPDQPPIAFGSPA